ncbi:MAG: phage tail tube protein [Hyphomonadaceae bacterium]|nr:phage tail tube protein [Hyphomonadaceae bacterium]
MASSDALIGYSASVYVETAAGSGDFSELLEITEFSPPSVVVDDVQTTHTRSPNRTHEFLPGLGDLDETTLGLNYIPGSDTDELIRDWRASGQRRLVQATYANGVIDTFSAYPRDYSLDVDENDKLTAVLTLKVAGAVQREEPDGATIFVDSDAVDDSGDGLTPMTAKKTIAAGLALVDEEFPTLALISGGLWREQITYPRANVTVRKWGSGAKPIIKASDIADNGDFAATGTANVYEIDWTHSVTPSVVTFLSVWVDGVKLVRVASEAACGALDGSYFTNGSVAAPTSTVMVHPPGSTNPVSDGKVYEITARNYCVVSAVNDVTLEGVVGIGCAHNDGVLVLQAEAQTMRDCEAYEGQKHNIFLRDGLGEDLYAEGAEEGSTVYISHRADPTTYNVLWRRCIADGVKPDGSTPTAISGFYAHGGEAAPYNSIIFEDCETRRCSSGFSADAKLQRLLRCKTFNTPLATRSNSSDGLGGLHEVLDCFFDGRGVSSGFDGNRIIEAAVTLSVYGTVVIGSERLADRILFFNDGDIDATFENCTFIGPDALTTQGLTRGAGASGSMMVNRCIFKGVSYPFSGTGIVDVDIAATNNVYHRAAAVTTPISWSADGVTHATFAAWQAAGYDLDGINADPLFTNPISGWDDVDDAVITLPAAVNLMAGATYYGVPRIAPSVSGVSFSGVALEGMPQTVSYTATGTPGLVPSYAWKVGGVTVSTAAAPPAVEGALSLTLTITNEGGFASATSPTVVIAPSVTTVDVDFIGDTAEQESVAYDDVADWLATKATFARSTTGTYLNAAGALSSFAIDAMRYGGAGELFLYEPSRTNYMLNSGDLAGTGWADRGPGTTTVTANDATAPDGTTTADKLVGNNGDTWWGRALGTGWASKAVAFSFWAKAASAFSGEMILGFSGAGTRQRVTKAFTTTMQRFEFDATLVAGDTGTLQASINHGSAHVTHGWGFQLEEAGEATSYIPTTTVAVTRAADALTLDLPAGEHYVLLTFDNDDQQVIEDVADNYTLTNELDRFSIQRLQVLSVA